MQIQIQIHYVSSGNNSKNSVVENELKKNYNKANYKEVCTEK